MKRLLLIGGAGFIGSNLVKALLKNGIFSIHLLEPTFANVSRVEGLNINIHRGLISDVDKVQSILLNNKIDIVIHLVSTLIPGSSGDDFENEFINITFPSLRLMDFCAENKIKFVYFSSGGTIYGNRKTNIPIKENSEIAPISYYGWSKQMMENSILFKNRTKNLEYLILRPSNPYGHGQNIHGKQGLVAVAIGKILSGQEIEVWGDGSSVRDYIYIDDLSKAIVCLLMLDNVYNKTINIGSGVGYSVTDIINALDEVSEEKVSVKYLPSRSVDVSAVVLDISLLKELIDFQPVSLKEGISRFYQEERNGK